MKTFTLFIATLLCMFTYTEGFALSSDSKAAHITFKAETNGKKIYFQSESDTIYGYQEVKPGETIALQLEKPAYYYYMGSNSNISTVFVTPGSTSRIEEKNGKISFEGDNAAINQFIQQHSSIFKSPDSIATYSNEWLEFQHKMLAESIDALKASNLPDEFKHIHE